MPKATSLFPFEESLDSLFVALGDFASLSSDSTMDEVDDATAAVEDAWDEVGKSIGDLDEANQELLEDSYKGFEDSVDSIPDDATVSEALDATVDAGAAFLADVETVLASY